MAVDAVQEVKYDIPTLHRFKVDEYVRQDGNSPVMFEPSPPQCKPFSRSMTNYSRMNEWMTMPPGGRARSATAVPVNLSDENWKAMRAGGYEGPRPNTQDYHKAYEQLMAKMPHPHPTFALPKKREGRHGSSWRNTREVIGMGPGRLMWIDGVVSLYDQTMFRAMRPSRQRPAPVASTPQFALNRHNISSCKRTEILKKEKEAYKPWYTSNHPQPLPYISSNSRPNTKASGDKKKGFYTMRQSYP